LARILARAAVAREFAERERAHMASKRTCLEASERHIMWPSGGL
jgi:hypothetical protein